MGKLLIVPNGADDCVMNATICAIRKYAEANGYNTIYGANNGFAGLLDGHPQVTNITNYPINILSEGCFLGITRGTPIQCTDQRSPYYPGKTKEKKETEDLKRENTRKIQDLTKSLDALSIDAMVVIGGDGTLRATNELIVSSELPDRYKRKIIGVINTMDNDIGTETTHATTEYGNITTNLCLGYSSCVLNLRTRLKELDTIVRDNKRIFSIEILGRDNGWPVAAAALADCEPLFFPEVEVNMSTAKDYIERVEKRYAAQQSVKVGVSEGVRIHREVIDDVCRDHKRKEDIEFKTEPVKDQDGKQSADYFRICQQAVGHRRLGGAGFFILMMLEKGLRQRGKTVSMSYDNSGYAPRIGSPSMYDLKCAEVTGEKVGRLLAEKQFGLIPVFSEVVPYGQLTVDRTKCIRMDVAQRPLPAAEYINRDRLSVNEAFFDFITKITSCPPEEERERELASLVLGMNTQCRDSELLARCVLHIAARDIK